MWYWGWFDRKEGGLPVGDGDEAAGAIPLRRFMCTACGRTFSWRPAFLLFGRRYAALFYQMAFQAWSLGRSAAGTGLWCDLSTAGRRAFSRFLGYGAFEVKDRLNLGATDGSRVEFWKVMRQAVRSMLIVNQKQPPLSIHLICLTLAPHPRNARYGLKSL